MESRKESRMERPCEGQIVAYQLTASRELSVAMVLYNDRNNSCVQAHSCRSLWSGTAVQHVKEYRKSDAAGSEIVLEPTEEPVKLRDVPTRTRTL